MIRKQGYYWVRYKPLGDEEYGWEVAYWEASDGSPHWLLAGSDDSFDDSDFADIDETPVCQRYYN